MDHLLWLRGLMSGLSTRLGGSYSTSFERWSVTGRSEDFIWQWAIGPVGPDAWLLELSLTPMSSVEVGAAERAWTEAFRRTRWLVSYHGGALHLATRIGWMDRLEVDSDGLEWTHHRACAVFDRARRPVERDAVRPPAPARADHVEVPRAPTLRPPAPGPTEQVTWRAIPRTPSERPAPSAAKPSSVRPGPRRD